MNPVNTILLHPVDILFFRDGRPMEGSLAGHGAAWPLPNVTDAAFHAALHRSGLSGHRHDQMHRGERADENRRQFGSLVTAGPFPVRIEGNAPRPSPQNRTWYFPRPLDLVDPSLKPGLLPARRGNLTHSSLPGPLRYAVANRLPPSKETGAKGWITPNAYQRYLLGGNEKLEAGEGVNDSEFSDAEATIGIAIDSETGTTGQGDAAGKLYSARYLRLRDEWRLGVFAKTDEKGDGTMRRDLIPSLIDEQGKLLVGGQQRLCTATLHSGALSSIPLGMREGFANSGRNPGDVKWRIKWILLSPAIWPEIPDTSKEGHPMTPHPGGWIPNWVRSVDGRVMLRSGERQPRRYAGKHSRGLSQNSTVIAAHLVAAIVPKPIPVTGWALANDSDRPQGGAKSTHLAVPAGAVYYFEAESETDAKNLAAALNWHGSDTQPTTIRNRRSTLMGEKGFGLGVCGTWDFFPGTRPQ